MRARVRMKMNKEMVRWAGKMAVRGGQAGFRGEEETFGGGYSSRPPGISGRKALVLQLFFPFFFFCNQTILHRHDWPGQGCWWIWWRCLNVSGAPGPPSLPMQRHHLARDKKGEILAAAGTDPIATGACLC